MTATSLAHRTLVAACAVALAAFHFSRRVAARSTARANKHLRRWKEDCSDLMTAAHRVASHAATYWSKRLIGATEERFNQ